MLNNQRPLLPQFKVTLDRTDGSPHGIEVMVANTVLLVNGINGGLIEAWNSHHYMLEVKIGDTIVEVNGMRGEGNVLAQELEKHQEIKIRLRRNLVDQELISKLKSAKRRSSSARRSTKKLASMEPAFLMDMVQGIPEQQAKRTLKNSLDADHLANDDGFDPVVLEGEIVRILDRVGNSISCSGWLRYKLEEYDVDDREKAAAHRAMLQAEGAAGADALPVVKPKATIEPPNTKLQDGLAKIQHIAEERTCELADDVAAVLGEEMQSLERRQKEQQRGMAHTQENLQGLRQMIYKLNNTCDEVGGLARRLGFGMDPKDPSAEQVAEQLDGEMMDPAAVQRLLGQRNNAGRGNDIPFHAHRFSVRPSR